MTLPHITFGAGAWLWALLLVPLLAFLYVRAERSAAQRLRAFVSPHLLAQLSGSVNRTARAIRYAFLLLGLALAILALAQPRWGYVFDETKREGLDLILAVDTSRSMLSNDVQPNRLERVKLATQDLVNELEGDRVGLIAFAGRAFLQAPLTIDYGAVIDTINELDTSTIPEGGTNISAAIDLALSTYTKSAVGNRALIIFTDGEELKGEAVQSAKAAAEAGIRIFTVGVGTANGSLIPVKDSEDGSPFVKDEKGQVVKSRLDEARLKEIAKATGGIYLHLENGPATMKQLITDGLSKMQAGEIDARLARRPIERYQWPLGAALLSLGIGALIRDRRRRTQTVRARGAVARAPKKAVALAVMFLFATLSARAADAPGLNLYEQQKFGEAYQEFQKTLEEHPQTQAADKLQFDSGAAAYKMKDYKKALESFSQALLSKDRTLQSDSHYNLGNTLYQRGAEEQDEKEKLRNWTDALRHYEQTLKLDPKNQKAKDNYAFVKKQIEDLKNKRPPTPTPTPSPNQDKNKKNQQKNQNQQNQQQQQNQQNQQQQKKDQQNQQNPSQSQNNQGSGNGEQQQQKQPPPKSNQSPTPTATPTPTPTPSASPSPSPGQGQQGSGSPTPSPGQNQSSPSPSPGASPSPNESPSPGENGASPSPTPTPGQNGGSPGSQGGTPSPTPNGTPKKFSGEVKGAPGEQKQKPQAAQAAEAKPEKEGEMSPQQAERLLQAMKDEEARVSLDERKPTHPVYKDW